MLVYGCFSSKLSRVYDSCQGKLVPTPPDTRRFISFVKDPFVPFLPTPVLEIEFTRE